MPSDFIRKFGKSDQHMSNPMAANKQLTSEEIHKFLDNNPTKWQRLSVSSRKDLTPEHIDKLIDMNDQEVNHNLVEAKHGHKFSSDNVSKLLSKRLDSDVLMNLARHPEVKDRQHLNHIMDMGYDSEKLSGSTRMRLLNALATNPNLHSDHIDTLLRSPSRYYDDKLAGNPALHPHHIDELISRNSMGVDIALDTNPRLTPEHRAKMPFPYNKPRPEVK